MTRRKKFPRVVRPLVQIRTIEPVDDRSLQQGLEDRVQHERHEGAVDCHCKFRDLAHRRGCSGDLLGHRRWCRFEGGGNILFTVNWNSSVSIVSGVIIIIIMINRRAIRKISTRASSDFYIEYENRRVQGKNILKNEMYTHKYARKCLYAKKSTH